ncbi:MAG: S41 family peptidase, partial [Bacillota bacterium]
DNLGGAYGGIGIYLEGHPDYPRVQEIFPGSPAMEAGLKVGDVIKKVDGVEIKGWPLTMTVDRIKGQAGTEVVLVVGRGDTDMTFRLRRANLEIPTIDSRIIGKNTGYIAVKTFGVKTAEQFKSHLDQLISKRVGGLVVDLRDNPGGYMDAALEMAEFFLEPGATIVNTRNYDGTTSRYQADKDVKPVRIPMVVLINSQSASSAEILVGALKDNGVATLVGEKTFGKGTAQNLIRLKSGGAMKITTTVYTTPKDRQVNGQGLTPDFEVRTRELQIPFALGLLEPRTRTVVFTAGQNGVTVDGERIQSRNAPVSKDGAVYLPLRFTLEALGYIVSWEKESGRITARRRDETIIIPAEGNPLVNGIETNSGGGVLMKEGVSYISPDLLEKVGHTIYRAGESIVVQG